MKKKWCVVLNELLKDVMEGRMEGKRVRGRPRKGMLDELLMESCGNMKRKVENRNEWKNWMPWTCRYSELREEEEEEVLNKCHHSSCFMRLN